MVPDQPPRMKKAVLLLGVASVFAEGIVAGPSKRMFPRHEAFPLEWPYLPSFLSDTFVTLGRAERNFPGGFS